jgi:hypothetical protein
VTPGGAVGMVLDRGRVVVGRIILLLVEDLLLSVVGEVTGDRRAGKTTHSKPATAATATRQHASTRGVLLTVCCVIGRSTYLTTRVLGATARPHCRRWPARHRLSEIARAGITSMLGTGLI